MKYLNMILWDTVFNLNAVLAGEFEGIMDDTLKIEQDK